MNSNNKQKVSISNNQTILFQMRSMIVVGIVDVKVKVEVEVEVVMIVYSLASLVVSLLYELSHGCVLV